MKHEILFRGRRYDNKEWVEGGIVQGNFSWILTINESDGRFKPQMVDPDTVGQFIPKEGFYEGDILYGKETDEYGSILSTWYGTVKYDEATGRIRIIDDSGDWFETDDFMYDVSIGNIHDNPELMQGGV